MSLKPESPAEFTPRLRFAFEEPDFRAERSVSGFLKKLLRFSKLHSGLDWKFIHFRTQPTSFYLMLKRFKRNCLDLRLPLGALRGFVVHAAHLAGFRGF